MTYINIEFWLVSCSQPSLMLLLPVLTSFIDTISPSAFEIHWDCLGHLCNYGFGIIHPSLVSYSMGSGVKTMSYLLPQSVSVAYTSARGRRAPRPLPVHDGLSMGPGFHKSSADSHRYDEVMTASAQLYQVSISLPSAFYSLSISSTMIPEPQKY